MYSSIDRYFRSILSSTIHRVKSLYFYERYNVIINFIKVIVITFICLYKHINHINHWFYDGDTKTPFFSRKRGILEGFFPSKIAFSVLKSSFLVFCAENVDFACNYTYAVYERYKSIDFYKSYKYNCYTIYVYKFINFIVSIP